MTVQLIPLSAQRFPAWIERSRHEYESDLIATGESPQDAHRRAKESLDAAFPENFPTIDNAVFDVIDTTGSTIGYLWVGTDSSEDNHSWWVWDIVIDNEHRGKGLGRATMKLAEDYARSHGAHTLGLSVFDFNHGARKLYESMGYETVTTKMKKQL
ncbi:GNAT family N-acetyltransferase [Arthrobacter sp. H35-D1]|uniref:GNAT family N-acetyltransferase n=1 Tax=Arthrobacter sp. H35-D1 TaxID=3046202 RepID=UPI0024BA475B|nr:GNAT family N-acetyltransferase [Arthrobacter sp. H35-D1]MDJ0313473.1 GNAT family N-acetyltransferase [Arthrobacter sp. H35-D1]